MILRPPRSTRTDTLFPYTTLFRSSRSPLGLFGIRRLLRPVTSARRPGPNASMIWSSDGNGRLSSRTSVIIRFLYSRSEERRVGKECVGTCRSRWSPYPTKKIKRDRTDDAMEKLGDRTLERGG